MVQAKESYSNQDPGGLGKYVFELISVLGRPEIRSRLKYLAKKLEELRSSDVEPRVIKNRRKRARRPGWVLDAVAKVLNDNTVGPMRVKQIHNAVEVLTKEKVSIDSVNWVLSHHCKGPSPLFIRVARGRYVRTFN